MNRASAELGLAEIDPNKEKNRNRLSRAALVSAIAGLALLAGSAKPTQASENGGPIMVGGFDSIGEQMNPNTANNVISKIRRVGIGDLKELVTWVPSQKSVSPGDTLALGNSIEAASKNGMDVILIFAAHTWGENPTIAPARPNQQRDFCDLVANTVRQFPNIKAVQIENEENNPLFWPHQFKPDGTDNVGVAYESLLARCYDAVKAINPDIEVIGGGLSAWGNDDPHSGRPSHSPTTFIANLGAAYEASGRSKPIMDAFGLHPYLKNGDSIDTIHPAPSTTIDAADYPKLVAGLSGAFDFTGSGQEGASLPIIYDEFGRKTTDTPSKQTDSGIVPPDVQAREYAQLLQMARCEQPTVKEVIFFKIIDNPDWTSGVYDATGKQKPNFYGVRSAVNSAQLPENNC